MLVVFFSIILIVLSLVERFIYKKMDESWNKARLFIGVMIAVVLFLISYVVTDTAIGVFYLYIGMSFYFLMGLVNFRSNIEWLKYISNIIGLPIMILLFFKMNQHILINIQYLLVMLVIVNAILCYLYKRKGTKEENITFGIGAVIVIIMMYAYFNLPDIEDRFILKQESVARKYLEEELDIQEGYAYMRSFDGGLRGEESKVWAYDEEGNSISMTYKNNKIVSHEIED